MGICVTQRCEFKGEDIVPVGESQGIDVWDGFLEYGFSADGNRFVEDFEARDHYRRHIGIVADIFREESIEPIAAAKEHLPIWALITTGTELIALQAVGHVVVSKGFRPRIESGYALLSAEPKPANSIFPNAPNRAARQALVFRVAGEGSVLPVEPVQSIKSSHPQCSSPVFVDGVDAAAVEFVRVTRVGRVIHKSLRLVIETDQRAAPRPQPQRAGTILINDPDRICQAGRIIRNRLVIGKPVRRWIEAA